MKKAAIIIVVLLVIGGAVGAFIVMNDPDKDKEGTTETNTPASSQGPEPAEVTEDTATENEASEDNSVEIEDFAFKPETITVKKGTTVTWTNKDAVGHTVTPDQESEAFKGSDLLDEGESYSFTFDQAGTYTYHCQPHPQMTGTVVVTE